jgi:hypothetical protein
MSHKPSTIGTGTGLTAVGSAGQTVATTKYSVGTAVENFYGDRYAKIEVKSTQAYTLYVLEYDSSFASTANSGAANGRLIETYTGCVAAAAATQPDGQTYYTRISGAKYVLPVLYQASGSDATVTIKVKTFND